MNGLLPQLLLVAAGGALGALGRYGMSTLLGSWFGRHFPWPTLCVNLLGSLVIGAMFVLIISNEDVRREWESALTIGFLGAFTTFSTFSLETVVLLQDGRMLAAGFYVLGSVSLCIAGCAVGMRLARLFI